MIKIILSLSLLLSLCSCFPAVFTTAAVTGITASKDQSFGTSIKDTAIWTQIKAKFAKEGYKDLLKHIDVTVNEGKVLLVGHVESEEEVLKATELVWQIENVNEVLNELKVNPESSRLNPLRYATDTFISTAIKSRLLVDKSVKFVNYNIITFDSVVYVFGRARSPEELEKINSIIASIYGVKKVVSNATIAEE